jgi:hypothetical protein
MNLSFELTFADLSEDKQEEMIKSVKENLLKLYGEEGEEELKRKWYVLPKNAIEAYCRANCIKSGWWSDFDENSEDFQNYDWQFSLEDYAEEQAIEKCQNAVHHTEVEVGL